MKFSVILLLEERYKDIVEFVIRLDELLSDSGQSYEILVVANGTGNFFRSQLSQLPEFNGRIRAFEFGARTTQAVCLKAIIKETQGEFVLICGAYQQLVDASMIDLINAMDQNVDVISPWRQNRVDPSFNQLQSRIFNWLVRRFIRTELHDFSCTVKVVRRTVLTETDLYGNMFRFLPVLAAVKGFRIKEVPVDHLEERGVTGFYSLSDYVARLVDIFTLFFNTSFTRKPLRFFSGIGISFILVGILAMLILFFQRFLFSVPIGNRPFLFLSLLLTILGVLISSAGLLGEIIAFTNGRHKKEYTIEKVIH